MKILLVRPKSPQGIGVLNLVNVEPLELEYLGAICNEEGAKYEIYDGSIDNRKFKNKFSQFHFDAVVLSGYINSIEVIKNYAKYVKLKNKDIKVIVGGVVAEVVPELLYSPHIDIIVHSGGFEPFRKLLRCSFNLNLYKNFLGICYRTYENWTENAFENFDIRTLPLPNRAHFYANSRKFGYLNYKPTAIMKTSYSCPYNCNFCYCRKLNGGNFICMDMDQIILEIKAIHCDNIWIVDDIFLLDRDKVQAFIDRIKVENINKNFIVYSRADFIVNNKDILQELRLVGVKMVIVGLEAVNDRSLKNYNKLTSGDMNRECIKSLKENNIECMGLFIAGIDYTKEDFRNLRHWIKASSLQIFTISVFTPLPGTELYEKYKDEITSKDYSKYDFLHLHINPLHMNRITFYFELSKVYIPYINNVLKKNTIDKLKKKFLKLR